ncbi:hypothetical protein CEXT_689241 [Caerostris extrusa]|uniref:Uncharacterized protein n=1 Tax=Caerostris extrusa TaxID=172846 RepID=A0AAV4X733_CAEEX|nr:hypothetical protein CEXT_689241 [Caerostris extrusa]
MRLISHQTPPGTRQNQPLRPWQAHFPNEATFAIVRQLRLGCRKSLYLGEEEANSIGRGISMKHKKRCPRRFCVLNYGT